MAEAKHTPGPWHPARIDEAPEHGLLVCDQEGGSIGDFMPPGPWMTLEEARANCRLAAAAPELLAAADKLWGSASPRATRLAGPVRHYVVSKEDMDALRAAIAKATGGANG